MISRATITPLPIWNALRRSYLNPLFLLCPIVSLPAPSQHTVVRSMVVGEEPVNRLCSSRAEIDSIHQLSRRGLLGNLRREEHIKRARGK